MYRILSTCLVVALGLIATNKGFALADARPSENSSSLTLDKQTQIPGESLKPGKYTIQVVDHLTDRMIIRVEDAAGKRHAVFLAVPNNSIPTQLAVSNGIVFWNAEFEGKPALRGFRFPSGYTVEFVYPKSEAAALAKSNQGTVLAVDPDSEGKPAVQHMSPDDLQMIHLWMLSLTTAGPNSKSPAILAQSYQPPASHPAIRVAANSMPAAPVRSVNGPGSAGRTEAPLQPTARKHSVVAALPHTASNLPILFLALCCAFLAAILIHRGLLTAPSQKAE